MYEVSRSEYLGKRYDFFLICNVKIQHQVGQVWGFYDLASLFSYKVSIFLYGHLDYFITFNLSIL